MHLSLKVILATGTLLSAALGFTNLTDAAPVGLGQGVPAIQSIAEPDVVGAPTIEKTWYRWHRRHYWHRWHHWHRWHYWHRWHRW